MFIKVDIKMYVKEYLDNTIYLLSEYKNDIYLKPLYSYFLAIWSWF